MARTYSDYVLQPLPDELEILRSTLYHLSEGVVVADAGGGS